MNKMKEYKRLEKAEPGKAMEDVEDEPNMFENDEDYEIESEKDKTFLLNMKEKATNSDKDIENFLIQPPVKGAYVNDLQWAPGFFLRC